MEDSFECDPFFSIMSDVLEHADYDNVIPVEEVGPTSKANTKRKRKLRKAPGAPKRFKSSYILFFMAHREGIKKELGVNSSVGEVSKRSSEHWKKLSKEEKTVWQEKARADKERYNLEKEKYKGPWQVVFKRAKKDPNSPKRPPSAFLKYSKEKRSIVKEQHPELKNIDIARLLGQMWQSAPPEERVPHIEREQIERKKYKADMAAWKAKETQRKEDEIAKNEEDQRKDVKQHTVQYEEQTDTLAIPFPVIPSPLSLNIPNNSMPQQYLPRYNPSRYHSQARYSSSMYEHSGLLERAKYKADTTAWKSDKIAKNGEDQEKDVKQDTVQYQEQTETLAIPFPDIPSFLPPNLRIASRPHQHIPRYSPSIHHSQARYSSSMYEHPCYDQYTNHLPPFSPGCQLYLPSEQFHGDDNFRYYRESQRPRTNWLDSEYSQGGLSFEDYEQHSSNYAEQAHTNFEYEDTGRSPRPSRYSQPQRRL